MTAIISINAFMFEPRYEHPLKTSLSDDYN